MMWLVDRAILTALRKKNLLSPGPDLLWAVQRDPCTTAILGVVF
jgi:hypothetical protein